MGERWFPASLQETSILYVRLPLVLSKNSKALLLGNCTCQIDKRGGITSYTFDVTDQLIAVKNAAGSLVKYTYDTKGQGKAVTDVRNYQTKYSYDTMGRFVSVTNALGVSVTYTYNPAAIF